MITSTVSNIIGISIDITTSTTTTTSIGKSLGISIISKETRMQMQVKLECWRRSPTSCSSTSGSHLCQRGAWKVCT